MCLCGDVLDENDVVWTLATDKTTGRYVLSVLLIFFGRVQPSCALLLFGEALPNFFSSLLFCLLLRCAVVTP